MFCLKLVLMERRELSSVTLAFCLYVMLPEAVVKHLVAAKSSACYRGALFFYNFKTHLYEQYRSMQPRLRWKYTRITFICKILKTNQTIEFNSLYLHYKIALKNEAK